MVVKQLPPKGRLSSFDKVTIVFAKPLHGVIPNVVGMKLPAAQEKLGAAEARPDGARAGREDRPAAAARRWIRSRARAPRHPLGAGRLTNREPASR